jgi:hypothetical protein
LLIFLCDACHAQLTIYQKSLLYGNATLNLTYYSELQCQEGYTGQPVHEQSCMEYNLRVTCVLQVATL